MKITKLGHCCLLIEEKGLRILTDPGAYSTAQNDVKNIDVVIITHEHQDHLYIDSLKNVIANAGSKGLVIITNKAVGKILESSGIPHYQVVEHGQKIEIKGVLIEGHGKEHAPIYSTVPSVENTGYFIANRLFYPGDAFYNPKKKVDILALPVAGPWMKISEAIDYAKEIHPNIAFPVHDGMFLPGRGAVAHRVPNTVLTSLGIKFVILEEGKETEL
jgi:L-ascorbate metabolism protein UlaG (beta-lactamase superfamily)